MNLIITAKCAKDGQFVVTRRKTVKASTDGRKYTIPTAVVCPSCRMWGEIINVKESQKK